MDETNTTYYAGGVDGNRRPGMQSLYTSNDANITAKTIFGVQITSKDVLVGLMDKIKAGGFDNEISGLTPVEREASHALTVDLARGFDYLNSDNDDSAPSLGDNESKLTSEKRKEVMDTICAMWDDLMTESPNLMSESPIVQSVSIQDNPSSYIATAGGSLPKPSAAASNLDPSKLRANFRSLYFENLCEGAKFSIPRKVVETISTRFANTLYGYFIGKRIAFPVVEYYVRNNWGIYGLTRIMMSSKGFFFFQFKTSKGLEDVLENGPWMIRNIPIILKKWTMNTRLYKDELTRILVSIPPTVVTSNVATPTVEKTNDGFQTMGKKKKKGKSKSTNGSQNQPLKATVTSTKEGNITMSNSYVALDDESDEDVENVYDESTNLFHNTKTGESSSTFTAAIG
ncbi:zinc knuckle CX2CX4HX4C containing protein [Tanacetum coccineum]